jgi:hypothetical protein
MVFFFMLSCLIFKSNLLLQLATRHRHLALGRLYIVQYSQVDWVGRQSGIPSIDILDRVITEFGAKFPYLAGKFLEEADSTLRN